MAECTRHWSATVVEHFSANHIPENPHRGVLHRSGAEMLAIAFALNVLNDFMCARHVMTLIVNDLERLADVQLSDTLQSEVVQFVEDTVQIEPGKGFGPHFVRAGRQRPPDQSFAIAGAAFHEHPRTDIASRYDYVIA